MKKFTKIIVVLLIVAIAVIFVAFFANSLFGNPISKHLAKNTALEYIEENYPDGDCLIEDIFFDLKYEDYQVHIISPTDENIDFSLYVSQSGELTAIEYWKSQTNPEEALTEENSTEENQPLESATPLTETEIKELFLYAHKLYVDWSSPVATYLDADWDKITVIDGVEYFEVLPNEINSVDDLKKEYEKYFSEEIIKEKIDKYYVMYNGKMYGNAVLVEGGEIPATKYELTVKSNTSTECNITITSYIEDSKDELNYKLEVINGEWKFVEVFNWVTMNENFKLS